MTEADRIFERFPSFIRDFIYANSWESLRGVQIAAAKVTGSTQPELSRILRGQFRSVSVERLLAMLTRLGCKVDIVVRPQGRTTESAVIHFA